MQIEYVDSVDSTNTRLYQDALNGKQINDTCLVAYKQTGGRGRRGRSFFSPDDTGLYLSILLHPACQIEDAKLITTMMAVAACKALQDNGCDDVMIKWVNDLYRNNKKIAGILTECSTNIIEGRPEFIVCGIGINLFMPDGGFPEDIKDKAGSAYDDKRMPEAGKSVDFKVKLSDDIVTSFLKYYEGFPNKKHYEEYKNRLFILGRDVDILDGPSVYVEDLSSDFALVVRHEDGHLEEMNAGEVSLLL